MAELDASITGWIDALEWPLLGLVRLLVAALCGGLVGLEREVRGRQAGFRTNTLVCVGCASAMMVSMRIAYIQWPGGSQIQLDPARIAYGVMAGIGFLGGGVIVRHGTTVRGLTTAAGIWCVAAIGLAVGMGLYLFAAMTAVVAFMTLWVLDHVSRFLPRTHYRVVTVRRPWADQCVTETVQALRSKGYSVVDWSFERVGDMRHVLITLAIGFRHKHDFDALERDLPEAHGLELVSVQTG